MGVPNSDKVPVGKPFKQDPHVTEIADHAGIGYFEAEKRYKEQMLRLAELAKQPGMRGADDPKNLDAGARGSGMTSDAWRNMLLFQAQDKAAAERRDISGENKLKGEKWGHYEAGPGGDVLNPQFDLNYHIQDKYNNAKVQDAQRMHALELYNLGAQEKINYGNMTPATSRYVQQYISRWNGNFAGAQQKVTGSPAGQVTPQVTDVRPYNPQIDLQVEDVRPFNPANYTQGNMKPRGY